jgi:hypothetical protein
MLRRDRRIGDFNAIRALPEICVICAICGYTFIVRRFRRFSQIGSPGEMVAGNLDLEVGHAPLLVVDGLPRRALPAVPARHLPPLTTHDSLMTNPTRTGAAVK